MAVTLTIRDVGAVSRSEAVRSIARVFGWSKTGAVVDPRINESIDQLVANGKVTVSDDHTLTLARTQ
jgi:hypothetical protein